jgi:hypothetical protein
LASLSLPQLKDAAAEEDLFGDMVTEEWIEVLSKSILRVDVFLLWFGKVAVFYFCLVYFVVG